MKSSISASLAAFLAAAGVVSGAPKKPSVSPDNLQEDVKLKDLLGHEKMLQQFARKYVPRFHPKGNRVFGGPAHEDTVMYIYNQIRETGAYDVRLQTQKHLWTDSVQSLTVNGEEIEVSGLTYGPSGDAEAELVKVDVEGCEAANFPPEVEDNIALIKRGTCTFSDKVALAGKAGAVGAIIYNNEAGELAGTLGTPTNPLGPYVPVVSVTQSTGEDFVDQLENGDSLNGALHVNSLAENRTTYNVIATTKGGDRSNIVAIGAHSDSVNEGPGINDDGSGTSALLAVAKALTKYSVKNAVRFCWFTGEEFGLLGSTFYVDSLSMDEFKKLALFIDIDMIASPNYIYQVYDGDGSSFNSTGPPGSGEIEALFKKFYKQRNIPTVPTEFDGRSDYQAFIERGLPAGGIFTGAEVTKTKKQALIFGGEAGEPYDPCYHQACDTINNLAHEPFLINTQAISYAIGTYATDLSSIPYRAGATDHGKAVNKVKADFRRHHS